MLVHLFFCSCPGGLHLTTSRCIPSWESFKALTAKETTLYKYKLPVGYFGFEVETVTDLLLCTCQPGLSFRGLEDKRTDQQRVGDLLSYPGYQHGGIKFQPCALLGEKARLRWEEESRII